MMKQYDEFLNKINALSESVEENSNIIRLSNEVNSSSLTLNEKLELQIKLAHKKTQFVRNLSLEELVELSQEDVFYVDD